MIDWKEVDDDSVSNRLLMMMSLIDDDISYHVTAHLRLLQIKIPAIFIKIMSDNS